MAYFGLVGDGFSIRRDITVNASPIFCEFQITSKTPPNFLKTPIHNNQSPSKSSAMSAPASKFKVADLSLAAFGRKEIELAEVQCPTICSGAKLTLD